MEKLKGSCEKKRGWGFGAVWVQELRKRDGRSPLCQTIIMHVHMLQNASSKREAGCTLTIISSLVLFYINVRLDSCSTITTSVFAIIGTINYVGNLFALLLE